MKNMFILICFLFLASCSGSKSLVKKLDGKKFSLSSLESNDGNSLEYYEDFTYSFSRNSSEMAWNQEGKEEIQISIPATDCNATTAYCYEALEGLTCGITSTLVGCEAIVYEKEPYRFGAKMNFKLEGQTLRVMDMETGTVAEFSFKN